jgi:prephenate dehydrogenase
MIKNDLIIGILGINGAFGKWLKNFFEKRGFKVIGSDLNTKTTNREVVSKADVVIFSILPISTAIKEMGRLAKYSNSDQIWLDVTSIKIGPMKAMATSKASFLGLHPMCRPSREDLSGQKLIVCWGRVSEEHKDWIHWFLKETGGDLKFISAEMHDELMSVIQNLFHAVILALAITIREIGISFDELNKFTSPFYRVSISLLGRILSQNSILYRDIQMENPKGIEVLKKFRDEFNRLIEIIENKNKKKFEKEFNSCREYIGEENAKKSSEYFSRIIREVKTPS